jgi:hypothetical protein
VFELRARRAAVLAIAALALSLSSAALADDKLACVSAYQDAQSFRKDGELRASKEQLVRCASEACPSVLSRDCAQWLREVEQALPTVVLSARGPDGNEAVEVRVTLDGAPLVDRLDGRAVAVDPGVHTLRFEVAGAEPIEERLVIREGEKLRRISVTFPLAGAPPSPPLALPVALAARPIPTIVYPLAAVGVLGLAGFGYFALDGLSKKSALDECRPNCAQSDVDTAKRRFLIGDISLSVGVVALAAASYFFFDRPSIESAASARAPRFDVAVGWGGATALLRGVF